MNVSQIVANLLRELEEQKEAMLTDFAISGAMPRDLHVLQGPVEWKWEGMVGQLVQPFRVV